jgi:hypothetical protein
MGGLVSITEKYRGRVIGKIERILTHAIIFIYQFE